MKKSLRVSLLSALIAACIALLPGCGGPITSVTLVPAPPGPSDLGPAIDCATPPTDAIVFDLKYLAQTGDTNDIQYFSFWGYGGSRDEAKLSTFLQEVHKKASSVYDVDNPSFPGRKWAGVEYSSRQASALYFDLNADGKLAENERILPTRREGQGIEFITPDFMQRLPGGGETLCRALLQVNFYGGSEPNCMWSPAALLDGTAQIDGKAARLLLYQSSPGGAFGQYGSSYYTLQLGEQGKREPRMYMPRETLSSLICFEDKFYHLTVDGHRTNGLPARALLVKDTSPTGELAVKVTGSNSLQAKLTGLSLNGVDDKTVFFRVSNSKEKITLPAGTYALNRGQAVYGNSSAEGWEVWFQEGPNAEVKAGAVTEVALGEPALKVRAIEENRRYSPDAVELTKFKRGTQIYLEPKIRGKGNEVFTRFRQQAADKRQTSDCPPHVRITGPDGKQVLSKTMEYG